MLSANVSGMSDVILTSQPGRGLKLCSTFLNIFLDSASEILNSSRKCHPLCAYALDAKKRIITLTKVIILNPAGQSSL